MPRGMPHWVIDGVMHTLHRCSYDPVILARVLWVVIATEILALCRMRLVESLIGLVLLAMIVTRLNYVQTCARVCSRSATAPLPRKRDGRVRTA